MNYIERISTEIIDLAIIIRREFKYEGIQFFTPDTFSQQIGYMNRPSGYKIAPHLHRPVMRTIEFTNEVLFIKKGKLRVDFYNDDKEFVSSSLLLEGDVILLIQGGHGFEMLEETEIIEVKQGPYAGDQDKLRFDSE